METTTLEQKLRDIRASITEDLAYWRYTLEQPVANPHACLTNLYEAMHKNFHPLLKAYVDFLNLDPYSAHQVQSRCTPADSYFCDSAFTSQIITHPCDHSAFVAMHTVFTNLLLGAELDLKTVEIPENDGTLNVLIYAMAKTMSHEECRLRLNSAIPSIAHAHESILRADSQIPAQNRDSIVAALPSKVSLEEMVKKYRSNRWEQIRSKVRHFFR